MTHRHQIWGFLRQHLGMLAVLVIACVAGLWFTFGILSEFLYFHDPINQDEALKPWMTPRYVVMSYDLPRGLVADVLGLPSEMHRGMTMADIAEMNDLSLDELTKIVRDAASAFRMDHPR